MLYIIQLVPLLICCGVLISRHQRLRRIPGPFIPTLTDLWRAYQQNFSVYYTTLSKLHRKYGSVVRVGPNNVSVSDASAVSTIYSLHGEFTKVCALAQMLIATIDPLQADSYAPMRGFLHGEVKGSIIDMQDENMISALRRAVGSAFAVSNLLDYEDDVDVTTTALITRMSRDYTFDLWRTMHQFQVDFFMTMAFSDEPKYLQNNIDPSPLSGHDRNYHWWQWQALPDLERFLYKNPYFTASDKSSYWAVIASQKLQSRKVEKDKSRKIDLLDKYIAAGEKHAETVSPDLIFKTITSTIGAGLDTTPFTMTTIIYYLTRNPRAYEALQHELDTAVREKRLSSPVPKYVEADQLPYLAAVIKETMRCYPFLDIPLERVVPKGGATVSGQYLPAGTVVSCLPKLVHHDKSVFGEDVDTFRPERWLEGGKEHAYELEKSTLGFGNGKRGCLGKHIAELVIKKVIPTIVLTFKMRLNDPNTKLESADGLTPFPNPIHVTFEERAK